MWRGLGDAWTAVSYLICGIAFWGGAGYGLDRLFHTGPALFVTGVLIGNAGGVYLIYLRTLPRDEREKRHAP
jgi:F0F1-type ATP synthase assembly protein I